MEGYLAYELPDQARNALAKMFPPKYPEFIGHHITSAFGVSQPGELATTPAHIKVIGYVEEDGLEALVVEVNGSKRRNDGKTYHITWSLDRSKGKKPVMSNDLIARGNWLATDTYEFDAPLKFFN
jgi:hypothetical protein